MQRAWVLLLPMLLVIVVSGCLSDSAKSAFVTIEQNFSARNLQYWSGMAWGADRMLTYAWDPEASSIARACPVHSSDDGENRSSYGDSVGVVFVHECDPSRINDLRNSDNETDKAIYVQISVYRASSDILHALNATMFDMYRGAVMSESDSSDAIAVGIANRTIDVAITGPLVSSVGAMWKHITNGMPGYDEMGGCNRFVSCEDSLFVKLGRASAVVEGNTSFGDGFVASCKAYFGQYGKELQDLRKGILGNLKGVGNADSYMNMDKICRRAGDVYGAVDESALKSLREPTERFFSASVFYRLSRMGDSAQLVGASLKEMVG